jgi:dTMP kinase
VSTISLEKRNGLFIVFEGIDGTGKSTQAKILREFLLDMGYQVEIFKEPTKETDAGKKIRASYTSDRPSLETELQWFIEDREWNVNTRVLPSLKTKKIVFLDRYYFSTTCYQGARKNGNWHFILKLNRSKFPEPDLTIIFDLKPKIALKRIKQTRQKSNTFEGIFYLRKVRKLFLKLYKSDYKGTYLLIDGRKSIDEITTILKKEILILIKEKEKKDALMKT